MKNFIFAFLLIFSIQASANSIHVRPDGGTPAQCNGSVNAPAAGAVGKACALAHPFYALPPNIDGGDPKNSVALLKSGDTLYIHAGSYQIGEPFGTGLYDSCKTSNPWDCVMQPIPSGTAAAHTKVIGDGSTLVTLWGAGGASEVVNMTGSSFVDISGLEITDHSSCIKGHPDKAVACPDNSVIAPWASNGIQNTDGRVHADPGIQSNNVTMTDIYIHGLAKYGLLYGNFSNLTVTNVRVIGNGFGGWSTDLDPSWSVSNGTNTFTNLEIGWSGCTEQYPTTNIYGCWTQQVGGYGDGFGTSGKSDKGTWIFKNSYIHDNAQDGLDFLHAHPSIIITFDTVNARNNAGNQLKTNGTVTIKNSTVVGGCGGWAGRNSTWGNNSNGGATSGDVCRGQGDSIVVGQAPGQTTTVINNTIISEGNTVVTIPCPGTGCGDKTSKLNITSNIMIGYPRWIYNNGSLPSIWWWGDGTPVNAPTVSNNIIYKINYGTCPPGNYCTDPLLVNETFAAFDPTPMSNSPALGKATAGGNIGAVQGGFVPPPPPLTCTGGILQSSICYCPPNTTALNGACTPVTSCH